MLRLRTWQTSVLRPDKRVVHRPAQVGRESVFLQLDSRAVPVFGHLTPHLEFRDVLFGQKLRRRALAGLEHRQQKMTGVRLFAPQAACQLNGLFQQLSCLPGKALVFPDPERFPNAHSSCSLLFSFCIQQKYSPKAAEKIRSLCRSPLSQRHSPLTALPKGEPLASRSGPSGTKRVSSSEKAIALRPKFRSI